MTNDRPTEPGGTPGAGTPRRSSIFSRRPVHMWGLQHRRQGLVDGAIGEPQDTTTTRRTQSGRLTHTLFGRQREPVTTSVDAPTSTTAPTNLKDAHTSTTDLINLKDAHISTTDLTNPNDAQTSIEGLTNLKEAQTSTADLTKLDKLELQQLKEQITKLQREGQAKDKEIKQLEEQNASKTQEIEYKKQEIEDKNKKAKQLVDISTNILKERNEFEAANARMKEEIEHLKKEASPLQGTSSEHTNTEKDIIIGALEAINAQQEQEKEFLNAENVLLMKHNPSAVREQNLVNQLWGERQTVAKQSKTIRDLEATVQQLGDTVLNQGFSITELEKNLETMRKLYLKASAGESSARNLSGGESSADSLSPVSSSDEEEG